MLVLHYHSCGIKEIHPYYISFIEMRLLWMEIKYIKSAARLLDRDWVNKAGLDLFKEALWVSVGQRAAELPAIKVGGLRKKDSMVGNRYEICTDVVKQSIFSAQGGRWTCKRNKKEGRTQGRIVQIKCRHLMNQGSFNHSVFLNAAQTCMYYAMCSTIFCCLATKVSKTYFRVTWY